MAPRPEGAGRPGYSRDEETFLGVILGMVEDRCPGRSAIPDGCPSGWRSGQDPGPDRSLVYVAHQLDILTRKPG